MDYTGLNSPDSYSVFETIPMEALCKAPDPPVDSNTIPGFLDVFDF
jgi:hypothetical protein